ncbi:hypothetical protein ACLESO_26495 [Pyxidicoccus sp. 3LG]
MEADTINKLMDGNGHLYRPSTPLNTIPAFQPGNGIPRPADNPRIYINGIGTSALEQRIAAQAFANATGQPVIAFRNPTEGFFGDVMEAIDGKIGGDNAAHRAMTESLASMIASHAIRGRALTIDAHSQGAIIVSSAVGRASSMLQALGRMAPEQAQKALGVISVHTYGGAAMSYPDGPGYVHDANIFDYVANNTGLGGLFNSMFSRPGAGATVNRFFGSFSDPHGFSSYLNDLHGPFAPPTLHSASTGSFGFGPFGMSWRDFSVSRSFGGTFSDDGLGIGAIGPSSFGLHGPMDPARGISSPSWSSSSVDLWLRYGNPVLGWSPIGGSRIGDFRVDGIGNPGIGTRGSIGLGMFGFGAYGLGGSSSSTSGLGSSGIGTIGGSGLGPNGFDLFVGGTVSGGIFDSNGIGTIGGSGLGADGFGPAVGGSIGGGGFGIGGE